MAERGSSGTGEVVAGGELLAREMLNSPWEAWSYQYHGWGF